MSLLHKQEVRKYILDRVTKTRPGWGASQVAASVYTDLDLWLRERIDGAVHRHPTIGKTVKEVR